MFELVLVPDSALGLLHIWALLLGILFLDFLDVVPRTIVGTEVRNALLKGYFRGLTA